MPAFNWYLKHWKLSHIYTPFINFKSWHDCFSSLSRASEISYLVVAHVLNCQEIFLGKGIYIMRNIFSSIQFKTGSWVRQGCSSLKQMQFLVKWQVFFTSWGIKKSVHTKKLAIDIIFSVLAKSLLYFIKMSASWVATFAKVFWWLNKNCGFLIQLTATFGAWTLFSYSPSNFNINYRFWL